MPVPIVEAPQWIINLSVIAAAAATAGVAWLVKHLESRKPEAEAKTGLSIVGGAIMDSRVIERLCDQLAHNERAVRDQERATIDNTRELERSREDLATVRHALEARNKAMAASDDELVQAIKIAAGRTPRDPPT